MPTGYTAAIADGISFKQYAMSCARAFGALVLMRDDPMSAEIPQSFEPSAYHTAALTKANARLDELNGMTLFEAGEAAEKAWQAAEADRLHYLSKSRELRRKYEAMLDQVKTWKPPTADHEGMAKFMREQIEESMRFDCSEEYYSEPTPKLSATEWLDEEKKKAMHDIEYHGKENVTEVARTNSRNAWIAALRESLKDYP